MDRTPPGRLGKPAPRVDRARAPAPLASDSGTVPSAGHAVIPRAHALPRAIRRHRVARAMLARLPRKLAADIRRARGIALATVCAWVCLQIFPAKGRTDAAARSRPGAPALMTGGKHCEGKPPSQPLRRVGARLFATRAGNDVG